MSECIAENRGGAAITRPNWSAGFSVVLCDCCVF
ncbi:hypothetical protein, partial [Escherichia coli]